MSSAICFSLDQSKILSSGNGLKYKSKITTTTTTTVNMIHDVIGTANPFSYTDKLMFVDFGTYKT